MHTRYGELFQTQDPSSPRDKSESFYFVHGQWIPFRFVPLHKHKLELIEKALFENARSKLDPFYAGTACISTKEKR